MHDEGSEVDDRVNGEHRVGSVFCEMGKELYSDLVRGECYSNRRAQHGGRKTEGRRGWIGDGKNVVEERSKVRCHGVCRSDSKQAISMMID